MRHSKNSVFGNCFCLFQWKTKFSNPIEHSFYSTQPQQQWYYTMTVSLFIVIMFKPLNSRSKSAVEKGLKTMYFQSISIRLLGERGIIRSIRIEAIEEKVVPPLWIGFYVRSVSDWFQSIELISCHILFSKIPDDHHKYVEEDNVYGRQNEYNEDHVLGRMLGMESIYTIIGITRVNRNVLTSADLSLIYLLHKIKTLFCSRFSFYISPNTHVR